MKIVDTTVLLDAIVNGDADTIKKELNKRLWSMISFHDTAENFYHGFLLGILSNIEGYVIKPNRKYGLKNKPGDGRSDIFMKTRGSNFGAVVLHFICFSEF